MPKSFVYLLLLVCFFAGDVAFADSKRELRETKTQLEEAKKQQAITDKAYKKLLAELRSLQKKLVKAAEQVRKTEKNLSQTEAKLQETQSQLTLKTQELKKNQGRLHSMIHVSLKLSRTPSEAVVLMPGDSQQTMKAARALKMMSQSIKLETQRIQKQKENLHALQEATQKQRDMLRVQKKTLSNQREALSAHVQKRQSLQKTLKAQASKEAKTVQQLAKKATSLQGLLSTLDKRKTKEVAGAKLAVPSVRPGGVRGKTRSFAKAKGKIRPPLSGTVVQKYGKKNRKNETHRGITIRTRAGNSVTAPYDAEVVYAGKFLKYGNIVILEHSDNYHTLLAGLGRITTSTGDFLLEGEPIGAMSEDKSTARLYMELRKKNQPINPEPWLNKE